MTVTWATATLFAPDAELYVYRLLNGENLPVGKWGPSVVFTKEEAKHYTNNSLFQDDWHWVRAGLLIYFVE